MKENWIIPCSPKYFDVVEHFKANDSVVWKKGCAIKTGDIVYLYVGRPYGQIKFKCEVISDNVDDATLDQNKYAVMPSQIERVRYIQMKKVYEYPDGVLQLPELKANGVGQVQRQARAYKDIVEFIDSIESR